MAKGMTPIIPKILELNQGVIKGIKPLHTLIAETREAINGYNKCRIVLLYYKVIYIKRMMP